MRFNCLRPFELIHALIQSNLLSLVWKKYRHHTISQQLLGEALADFMVRSGPVFIKLGQLLSTRQESFSQAFLQPLTMLQDKVAAFDSEHAKECIEQSFGKPITDIFSVFQTQAIASASIAQVHIGTLHDGQAVVAKIIRPHVRSDIQSDLWWLKKIATLCHLLPSMRSLQCPTIISEFERILIQETNLRIEAGAMSQARRNHQNNSNIIIPKVIWPYVSEDVLIMEHINAEPFQNIAKLKKQGVSINIIAQYIIKMFMKQIFVDANFHADLHPGNILINTSDISSPKIVLIDFGIMGQLSIKDRYFLHANFQALLKHDYQKVAKLHIQSGWVPSNTSEHDFAIYARSVIEPISHIALKDISIAQLLSQLLSIGKKFNMQLLPELILLQKSLIHVESIVRQLDSNINVWQELNHATYHSLTLYLEMLSDSLHNLPPILLPNATPDKMPKNINNYKTILYCILISTSTHILMNMLFT